MRGTKFLLLALLISLPGAFASADQEITYKEVAISVMDAFVPGGIKANQNAYVVVNGLFPNSCYSLIGEEVKHVDGFTHEIRTIAKVRSGICLRVLVPFNREISLGQLSQGTHVVRFISDDATYFEKNMTIVK